MRTIDDLAVTESDRRGPTVLWIHGYTLDSTIWQPLWTLMPRWHHVGVDLPGHGGSPAFEKNATLVDLARRINRVAQFVGAEHLVALSFGGMVAIQSAIEAPRLFASVTVNSAALGGGPQDRYAQVRHLELLDLYRRKGPGPWLRDLWMASPPEIFAGVARHPVLWEQLGAVVARHQWRELGDGAMATLTSHAQTPSDLRQIESSTLVIIGEHDMTAFKRCAELVRRDIPRARRVYLSNSGHLGLLEEPEQSAHFVEAHMLSARRPVRTH